MSELLPCPCCGCAADAWYSAQTKRWSVKCYVCGLRTREYDTEQEAIEAWNTRAERTCENMQEHGFECSECGFLDAWFDETIINYCPLCGAKVVKPCCNSH